MRFPMPNYPCEVEIPDAWLADAGMGGFTRSAAAFRSVRSAVLVPLQEIVPPPRFPTAPKDWHGFDRERLVSLLKGIAAGAEIEPVPLLELPGHDIWPPPYRYRVRDGFHRFYASIAAGFECLPGTIT
jgi:hypothetical protein